MGFKNWGLGTKLVFFIVAIITAMMIVTTFAANKITTGEVERGLLRILEITDKEALAILSEEKKMVTIEANSFKINNEFVKGLVEGNREIILQEAVKIFTEVNNNGVDILEIGDARGTVLVRAHDPQMYGDTKADSILYKKALDGETTADLDIGKSGLAVRAIAPIVDKEGRMIGTITVGKRLSDGLVDKVKADTGADVTIFDGNKRIATTLIQDGKRVIGTTQDNQTILQTVLQEGKTYHGETELMGKPYKVIYNPLVNQHGDKLGMVFVGLPKEVVINAQKKSTYSLLLIALIAGLAASITAYFISLQIVRPINKLKGMVEQVAKGDLSQKIESNTNQDEIGLLTQGFAVMVDNLKELVNDVSSAVEQMNLSTKELAGTAEESTRAADQVAQTVEELAMGADEQSKHINDTSGNIKEVAQLVTGVVNDTQKIADNSNRVARDAYEGGQALEGAIKQMKEIRDTVSQSADAVGGLGERSQEIGNIVEMITGIAEQTNLLALNAAIEAARAGEQGRGFAVVAEEVRVLAEQSAQAAKQIASLIQAVQRDTENTVRVMNQGEEKVEEGVTRVLHVGEIFKQIIHSVEAITSQIQGVAKAAENMGERNGQVVEAIDNIASIIEESAASTEEVSATAQEQTASVEEIAAAADTLARMAEDLQHSVNKFKL